MRAAVRLFAPLGLLGRRLATSLLPDRPSGGSACAPALNPDYRCADCPARESLAFLVFPQLDVLTELAAGKGAATVSDIRLANPDEIVVTVRQARIALPGDSAETDGSITYTLDSRSLRLIGAEPSPGYLVLHKTFTLADRLDHAFGPRDEMRLRDVLRWTAGRFEPIEPKVAALPAPTSH